MKTIPENSRIYLGQDLGVKWPNGDIAKIGESAQKRYLRLDEDGFYRVLDHTPLGHLEIVILD